VNDRVDTGTSDTPSIVNPYDKVRCEERVFEG